jgi:hypothetical protein
MRRNTIRKVPRPGWAPDPLMVGIRSPDGLVVGLAPATLEFWVRFPNERNQGKQAHPVLKYRVPQGSQDAPLRIAAQRKIAAYQQQYADNNISFLPAIVSTSTRMHGEFLRLLFLQAHRETEAHFTAAGMSSQRNQSDSFRFKRAAFYNGLKSKVGLAAAKAAALRVNLNVQGCGIVAPPMHASSRTPLLLPLLLSHNLPTPRVH